MLIAFGGLPGTGKTTIAQVLARRVGAIYLRIDVIEQAIRDAAVLAGDIGPAGYQVANALAASNLALGRIVVADSVNPVAESRAGWRAVAASVSAQLVEVEVVCSDPTSTVCEKIKMYYNGLSAVLSFRHHRNSIGWVSGFA